MIARRAVLAGIGALGALPARSAGRDVALLLDAAAAAPPQEGAAMLARVATDRLSPGRRLDVAAARAGLAIDATLAQRPGDLTLHIGRTLGDPVDLDRARARLDRELATLHARAADAFDHIGLRGGTIGARYRRLFADWAYLYPDDVAGRARAVADMARTLAAMPVAIDGLPAYCRNVGVRALDAAEIAAGRQGYREVPSPGRAGRYVVDLRDIARRPSWSLPAVVAHELLPGHMAQLGIEATRPPHPLRLRYAAAVVEGWATYAETLPPPPADPRVLLGNLHWLIFRAARARIDIGLHADRWSLADALARLDDWQGVPVYFAPFATDVARIAAEPGARAAEGLAWLAIADRAPRMAPALRTWLERFLVHGRTRLENWP